MPSQQSLVVLWSDAPEWLVLRNNHNLYRIRPDGSGLTRLTASEKGIYDTGWAHHSGVIGLIEGDLFSALWVDTNEILWQLKGVQEVLIGKEVGNPTYLDENWLYFRMTDGRYARCRLDGSSLTYYVSPNFPILSVRGWSSDGQWLWFETSATDPNKVDAMRVQADTGKVELMVDEMTPAASLTWTPDNRWAYYYDSDRQHVVRIRLDDNRQSEIVSNNAVPYSWTPPYQAEWQPTHTLTIGIGLMSFSTLTLIVLWRRRHKPRTT
ncbi:MAG: SMP-30/gluconolactonase/LRE family protein [Anaerolineae bacterium]|nr:SMP-30/gluconolactonase/LRE family protein [Anaerolineae bacterium]